MCKARLGTACPLIACLQEPGYIGPQKTNMYTMMCRAGKYFPEEQANTTVVEDGNMEEVMPLSAGVRPAYCMGTTL